MSLFRKVIWWMALPMRCVVSFVILVLIYPLSPYPEEGVIAQLKLFWRRP